MANALIQLAACGQQDVFLTDDPHFTYWQSIYKKHSNFSIESISQTLIGVADFGNKISCTISKHGDLMWRTYVELTIPSIDTLIGDVYTNTYSNRIGFCILKEVELRIGGKKIDSHYSTWMHIWTELTHNISMKSLLDKMVGNKGIDGINGNNNNPGTLIVPLLFSYCMNPGLAIPLVSLEFHEVEIIITFETFNNCISDLNVNNNIPIQSLSNVNIWIDYIFLDEDERNDFSSKPHDYLIEVLQIQENSINMNGKTCVDLSFNHPTKLLSWVIRDSTVGITTPRRECIIPIISLGANHVLALKSDGTLWGWGLNNSTQLGRLGLGPTIEQSSIVQITNFGIYNNDNLYISAGSINSFVIKQDGTLWATGNNNNGSLGLGDIIYRDIFTQVLSGINNNWYNVSGNNLHTLGLKNDNTLWAWGYNNFGQLGTGDNIDKYTPTQITINASYNDISKIYTSKAIGITATNSFSAVIKNDNTLWTTGMNLSGQLGLGDNINKNTFTQVITGGLDSWNMVSLGDNFMVGIMTDGTLWAWGNNTSGQLGLGNNTSYNTPQQVITGIEDNMWVMVECGNDFTIARKSDNTIWSVGNNTNGQLARGTYNVNMNNFGMIGTSEWIDIKCGYNYMAAINSEYYISFAGYNLYGEFGQYYIDSDYTSPTLSLSNSYNDWKSVGFFPSPSSFTLFIKANGTLWACGVNAKGQLGLGDTNTRYTPIQVTSFLWDKVATGSNNSNSTFGFSAAIKSDGTLWTWGYNNSGQLGLGDTMDRNVPTQVGSDTDWIKISCSNGGNHMIGLKSDNTVWGWGLNTSGQLGLSTYISMNIPTQIGSYNDINDIYTGLDYTIIKKSNNTIWSTGGGLYGQLGLGSTIIRNTFAMIGTDTYSMVSTNIYSTIAIRTDNTMWSWGDNTSGQLGLGNTTSYNTPQQIITGGSNNDWEIINSAGNYSPKAIKTNGTLWTWGSNAGYSLGIGNNDITYNQLTPIMIGTDNDYVDVYIGTYIGMAIKSNGVKLLWGSNAPTYLAYTDTHIIDLLLLSNFILDNCVDININLFNINYFTNFGSIESNNTLDKAKITINGNDRFKERDGTFFNYIMPYQHFNIKPDVGINCYSFALKPYEYYPSGTFNLSMVDKLILEITPTYNTSNTTNKPLNLSTFALGYNVLRISDGMGGLAFNS
jgi:alpha-tubulin suppressor-like RCC1 family protein